MTKHFNKVIDVTIKTLLITGDTLKFCVQKRKKLIIMFMQARTYTYTYTHIYTHTPAGYRWPVPDLAIK